MLRITAVSWGQLKNGEIRMNIKRDFILFILFSGATFAKDYAMVKPLSQREIQDITVNFVQPLREDKELRQAVQKLYDRIRIDATQKDFNPGNYAASCLRVMLEWISQTNKHPEYRQIGVYRDAFTNRISEDKQKENITELITKLGDLQKNQTKVEECLDILRQIVNADEQVKLVELLGWG